MEMRKERDKKEKRKRGNNRDEKSEEEEEQEECVGSAPSLKDDSQLSLSTPVTRNEPRLVEWKREKSPLPPASCFAMPLPRQPRPCRQALPFLPRCGRTGIKKGVDSQRGCAFFQHQPIILQKIWQMNYCSHRARGKKKKKKSFMRPWQQWCQVVISTENQDKTSIWDKHVVILEKFRKEQTPFYTLCTISRRLLISKTEDLTEVEYVCAVFSFQLYQTAKFKTFEIIQPHRLTSASPVFLTLQKKIHALTSESCLAACTALIWLFLIIRGHNLGWTGSHLIG